MSAKGEERFAGVPSFVGRAREMASVREALARPQAVVLVEGEAGVGKSRLVQEFLACDAGGSGRALVAVCPPFRDPLTLGPVVDAVREVTDRVTGLPLTDLAGALRPLFPEWASDLPPLPESAEDGRAARHRLFRALHELLGALGAGVLVVEDAHWADEATAEFLLFLVSLRVAQIRLVITYRPEDVQDDSLLPRLSSRQPAGLTQLRIRLEPLTVAETALLVSSMLDNEPVSEAFATFLHDSTDGLPLAVEESVRLMHDRADLTRRADGWSRRQLTELAMPPTIHDAVLERFRRLGPDAQTVLSAAAVLADSTDHAIVFTVSDLVPERAADGLAEALGSGLLQEDRQGRVGFRHALACRAVYEAMSALQRRGTHLRAGRALQGLSPPPVARLARHFREAGETEDWCRYAEQAADQAIAAGNVVVAAAMLHELVLGADWSAAALLRIIRKVPFNAFTDRDRFRDLVRALRSTLADHPDEEGQLRAQLGRILVLMEEYGSGRSELKKAILHRGLDPFDVAHSMILLGWPHHAGLPAAEHRRWLRRAAEVMPTVKPLDLQHELVIDRATALLALGEEEGWAAAEVVGQTPRTPNQRQRFVRANLNLGDLAILWGRYDEADRRLSTALIISERYQYLRYWSMTVVNLVRLDWYRGAWDGLAARADELADDEGVSPLGRVEIRLVVGLLCAAMDGNARASEKLWSAHADAQRLGVVLPSMTVAGGLARILIGSGDEAAALAVTDEPMAVVAHKGVWIWATDLVPARLAALLWAGRVGEAGELVAAFARGLRGRDAPAPLACLVHCRAMLAEGRGRHGQAAALFERAAAAWAALPRPYDEFSAREHRAECLFAAGRQDAALVELSHAFQGFARLGARVDAERVRRVLRAHGVEARRAGRGGRPSYGNQLSPRELEVARLVAEGQTNREIAEALVLSVQTVGVHVRSAMHKLGVSSRTLLAVRLVESGGAAARRS